MVILFISISEKENMLRRKQKSKSFSEQKKSSKKKPKKYHKKRHQKPILALIDLNAEICSATKNHDIVMAPNFLFMNGLSMTTQEVGQ
jgi:hypothetical protein